MKTFGSPIWSLSITNPFYLVTIISFFSSMVVTPVCYAAIHRYNSQLRLAKRENKENLFSTRFRNKQDENVTGISRKAKVLRKRRNLVSVQFNLINWLLETISLIPVMFVENVFLSILYLLVNSCGTPLVILFKFIYTYIFLPNHYFQVYFLGIEENRRLAREHFQSRIRIFTRNKDKSSPIQDDKEA